MPAYGKGRFGLGVYGIGDATQLVTLGQATETDTATALRIGRSVPLAQALEADSAQPVFRRQRIAVGQAVEADVANSVFPFSPATASQGHWSYGVAFGMPTVLPGVKETVPPAGSPHATSVRNPLVGGAPYLGAGFHTISGATGKGAAVGPNREFLVEFDSFQEDAFQTYSVVWTNDDYSLSGILWSGSGYPVGVWTHTLRRLTTPAAATQVYFCFGGGVAHMNGLSIRSGPLVLTGDVAPANEDDTARPMLAGRGLMVGRATELDEAQPLHVIQSQLVTVGKAVETDAAQLVEPHIVVQVPLAQAAETDAALLTEVLLRFRVPLVLTQETDEALPLTPLILVSQVVDVDQASETDTAGLIEPVEFAPQLISLGRATETDTARPLTVFVHEAQVLTLGRALELSEAFALGVLIESPYVEVTHTYARGDGTPAEGVVAFAPRFPSAEGVDPPPVTYTNAKVARLVDGELDIRLLEANPDNTDPSTWTYRVVEEIDNMLLDYDAVVDFEPLIVDLRELVPVLPDDGVP